MTSSQDWRRRPIKLQRPWSSLNKGKGLKFNITFKLYLHEVLRFKVSVSLMWICRTFWICWLFYLLSAECTLQLAIEEWAFVIPMMGVLSAISMESSPLIGLYKPMIDITMDGTSTQYRIHDITLPANYSIVHYMSYKCSQPAGLGSETLTECRMSSYTCYSS